MARCNNGATLSPWRCCVKGAFTSIYGVNKNSDGGQKTPLTAGLLWPSHGALDQHICKQKPERFNLQVNIISLYLCWAVFLRAEAYVVPDNRKGVRTPSTRTMFFTPGRASVFLLFVWAENKIKTGMNTEITGRRTLIVVSWPEESFWVPSQ